MTEAHLPVSGAADVPLKALRSKVYAATVTEAELQAIKDAVHQAGYPRPAVAARVVLLAFVGSAEVRDAVARWLRTHAQEVL